MSLPRKSVELMTCAECGQTKAWPDAFPSSIYAVCWKCNCADHMRRHHAPKKPGWVKRFRVAWRAASACPAPSSDAFGADSEIANDAEVSS